MRCVYLDAGLKEYFVMTMTCCGGRFATTGLALVAGLAIVAACMTGQQGAVAIDSDDIGGVVTSENGPEAAVWVIAETDELPTDFIRSVVTDDQGRYVLPDLPEANYSVWVRGYGLVDSPKVQASPGTHLDLTGVVAPDEHAAAQYYPAMYWYALLEPPPPSEFPGTGLSGNGIPESYQTQGHFLSDLTLNGCVVCHQMGTKPTRDMPQNMGTFDSTLAAWQRRVQSGQSGGTMGFFLSRFGPNGLSFFADWTDRMAAGELPPVPPRPSGIEQNVVVSLWGWGRNGHQFVHDEITTDKRDPTVNPYGPVYGATEYSSTNMVVLDPVTHVTTELTPPFLDPSNPPPVSWTQKSLQPSPVWGEEPVFHSTTNPHSLMMDGQERIWVTSATRPAPNPDYCKEGSSHLSAQVFPIAAAGRHLSMYDPATEVFTPLDTCFNTHHVMFDQDDRLWFSTLGQVIGWFDTRVWEATGDMAQAQGWTPFILDINGNGEVDEYVGPDDPVDPNKDKRVRGGTYGVIPNPADGSIWTVASEGAPGAIYRLELGSNPPATTLAEIYQVPYMQPDSEFETWGTRGIDIDRNGLIWAGLGSGHMASFDRRKCTGPLNGPTATGQHCPEGWTFYKQPGPNFKGVTGSGITDSNYYTYVDQFGAGNMGPNIPIGLGNNSDSVKATLPDGTTVSLRIPYPMGFHPKGMDARIDDPEAGWKGRGLWSAYAGQVMWHIEGGKGQVNRAVQWQVRPDPLAK